MANRFGSVEHLREQLKRNEQSRPGVRNFVGAFPSEDVRVALRTIMDLQELVTAGENLANAVGPLVAALSKGGVLMATWLDLLGVKRDPKTGIAKCDNCGRARNTLKGIGGRWLCGRCSRKKQSAERE